MKRTIFTLITLLGNIFMAAYSQDFTPSSGVDYVEIKHTGASESSFPLVFITMKKIYFPFHAIDTMGSHMRKQNLTPDDKNILVGFRYQDVVTDKATYGALVACINDKSQQRFYSTKKNKNHGDVDDYVIIVNGIIHEIYYKYKEIFFEVLRNTVKLKKGDLKVIEALQDY